MKKEELKNQKQWVNWNYKIDEKGNKTKVPISYRGNATGTNKEFRNTWTDYNSLSDRFDGKGLIFTNGICGIDIDHKDADDPTVQDIINLMDTYTELSPSKNGFHLLFKVDLERISSYINRNSMTSKYYQKNPFNHIECYLDGITNRFFTFTDNSINDKDICDRTDELLIFLDRYMLRDSDDIRLIKKIKKSKQADKFHRLYDLGDTSDYNNDDSSADMGLCCILAYYTQDFNQIDRLFRNSKLMREKWKRKDYRESTINKALEMNKDNCENTISELEFITAKELQNKELPPTIYYVDGIIPQGLNIICSKPKMGKSWLALDLCLSICNGKRFLGFKTKQCGCLYLALEDSYNRLKQRMTKLVSNESAPNNFYYSIRSNDLKNGFITQLESFIDSHSDIKVIIIDTLQKIRSESKGNNAYSHDYKELSEIKNFADKYGLCIILIHHLKKGTTIDPFEGVSGTNGVMGVADSTYILDKPNRSDDETHLSVVGRDVEYNEYILKFDKDSCKWNLISTVDKYEESQMRNSYSNNTLVDTIKTLLNDNNDSWNGTIRSINDKHKELYGYNYSPNEIKLRNEIDKIAPMLLLFDKIKFIPANGTNNGKRLHSFIYIN